MYWSDWDLKALTVELYGAMSFGVSRMISASMKTSLGYWSAASRNSEWRAAGCESFEHVTDTFILTQLCPKEDNTVGSCDHFLNHG